MEWKSVEYAFEIVSKPPIKLKWIRFQERLEPIFAFSPRTKCSAN
jgi:hypothetical protein